jgi:carboxymethylenebutenolidase
MILCEPEGSGPFPAVLVVRDPAAQKPIDEVCQKLACEGYVALAPDFPLAPAATNEDLASEIDAALALVRTRPNVDSARVGIVGFGFGGFVAFLAACRTDVVTAVSFYGEGMVRLLRETPRNMAPILCLFGAEDDKIPARHVGKIRSRLSAQGVMHEIIVYPRAGRGFFGDGDAPHRRAAAADAWTRTLRWLARMVAT